MCEAEIQTKTSSHNTGNIPHNLGKPLLSSSNTPSAQRQAPRDSLSPSADRPTPHPAQALQDSTFVLRCALLRIVSPTNDPQSLEPRTTSRVAEKNPRRRSLPRPPPPLHTHTHTHKRRLDRQGPVSGAAQGRGRSKKFRDPVPRSPYVSLSAQPWSGSELDVKSSHRILSRSTYVHNNT